MFDAFIAGLLIGGALMFVWGLALGHSRCGLERKPDSRGGYRGSEPGSR
jgi:hypothetical protein